jgi:hypothetical protein
MSPREVTATNACCAWRKHEKPRPVGIALLLRHGYSTLSATWRVKHRAPLRRMAAPLRLVLHASRPRKRRASASVLRPRRACSASARPARTPAAPSCVFSACCVSLRRACVYTARSGFGTFCFGHVAPAAILIMCCVGVGSRACRLHDRKPRSAFAGVRAALRPKGNSVVSRPADVGRPC